MSRPVILGPEAEVDIAEASDWYERQRPGLGQDFLDAADDVFARLVDTPEMHQVIWQAIRRAKLRRFPYHAYYEILPDRVEVIAVLHGRRNPAVWRSRA